MTVFKNRLKNKTLIFLYQRKALNIVKSFTVFLSLIISGSVFSNVASWDGFGGAYVYSSNTFAVPAGSNDWAGFANSNENLKPISLPNGGIITFSAASSVPVDVIFKLERLEHPDTEPSFTSDVVRVNNSSVLDYSVIIPTQGGNTFNSFILYVRNPSSPNSSLPLFDTPVFIKNVRVLPFINDPDCDDSPLPSGTIKIEAECYLSQDGIQLESTSDSGGGQNVGYIDAFNAMTYSVDIPSSGNYLFNYRIASNYGSDPGFRVFVNDVLADEFSTQSTGGWQDWITRQGRVINLPKGIHTVKFKAVSNGMNLNWFSMTPTNSPTDVPPSDGASFDGSDPVDSDKWFHQTLLPPGEDGNWFNGEVQHYTNRIENSFVSDGTLKIVARHEIYEDQGITKEYTSARLNSKFAFKYGRVEFRAKMPTGSGTWPAVWMLGKSINEAGSYWDNEGYGTTNWPAVGEIDILEHWGSNQNYAQSAMHTTSSNRATNNKGGQSIPTISSEFHTYTMDWSASSIIFKIDGVEHYTYNPSVKNADTWPYDSEFFLLLNVAIEPEIVSGFTQSVMELDYIRVYQSGDLIWSDEFGVTTDVDSDGDGVIDTDDAFPNNSLETLDSDGDGVGDNTDYAPNDPSVQTQPVSPSTVSVTFQLNMAGVDTSSGVAVIGGAVFGQAGLAMTDDNGDGIYTVTTQLDANSTVMFKYRNTTATTWSNQEDPAGLIAGGCGTGNWSDRSVVTGEADIVLDVVAFGSCTSEPYSSAGEYVSVTFQLNMAGIDTTNGVSVMGGAVFGQAGLAMTDDNGDGIYTVTTQLDANAYVMFKYRNTTAATWDNQEVVPADCANGEWGDRLVTTADVDIVLNVVAFSSCTELPFGEQPLASDNDNSLISGNWKLSPISGSLGVGPGVGDKSWWSTDDAEVLTRACLYDDLYSFNSDGSFTNVMGDYTWIEEWQGPVGCGAPVTPFDGSNSASYSYDASAGTLTLTGLGAHIGLPKVINGAEISDVADAASSIIYTVSAISDTAMTLDINFGPGYWRFELECVDTSCVGSVDGPTTDTDGDGVNDNVDAFPYDANETYDSDGDGVGDNSDVFPNNPTEWSDLDADGVGNNADAFPNNATEWSDLDGDGFGDNADLFPNDATESSDTDGDGVGDNADVFPDDANETIDSDGDGVGDNMDTSPLDPNASLQLQSVSVSNNPKPSRGAGFTLDVSYDVTSNDNTLTGIGLRVHYDSSKISFVRVSNYIVQDNIIKGDVSQPDTEDFDNNPSTDRYVIFAWVSVTTEFPNVTLPANLLSLDFVVESNVALQNIEYTTIGFSSGSNHTNFGFLGNDYQLQITPATWDIDRNGETDALTDGLLMLRHTFGLTGDALLDAAVANNSPLSHTEIIDSIATTMAIADIDGNGKVDALTDGLLLLRYLFDLNGASLVNDAVAIDATRFSHYDIEEYIARYMSAANMVQPDNTPPEITLNGEQTVGLAIGDNYLEAGATATDAIDGDVVVTISGSIGSEIGTYSITYSAVDAAGNSSSLMRTVVVDQPPSITSFKFLRSNNPSLSNDVILDISSNNISGRIPENISVKSLVPTYTHDDGTKVTVSSAVQVNSSSSNDFTQPIEYKVSKDSGVSKIYSVDLTKFTGLPIIYITTTNYAGIDSKEEYVTGTVRVDGGRHVPDMPLTAIEIKGRGNSTWGLHPKKPYQMKFSSKEEFLGMPEDKKWIFLAEHSDKTMLRNTTVFEMGYISNLDWTPQSEFSEIYLNNQYQGTYNITQKVEETNRRVAITNDGFLLEIDQPHRLGPGDVYFSTDQFNVIAIKEPNIEQVDENGLSFNQDPRYIYVKNFVNEFENVLFSSNFTNPLSGYAAYIDVDSFVDWFLINEIIKNVDARWYSSIYFHLIPGDKIKMGPLWDHDLGFGNTDYADSQYTNGWWIQQNYWINRLLDDPNFVSKVKTRFDFFRNNEQYILNKIDAYAERLQWAQQENDDRWQTLGQYVWPNSVVFQTYQEEVNHMKQWYQTRMNWLDNAIDSL
jgi:beta-glucanase (GH16 family)